MANHRIRFLASDEEFDDFAFEVESVDFQSEMAEYKADDDEEELEGLFVVAPVRSPSAVVVVQTASIEITRIETAPMGVSKRSDSASIAASTAQAKKKSMAAKTQAPKTGSMPKATTRKGKADSKPASTKVVANTERKISTKTGMKNATKKAVKKAAKKAAVKAQAKKAVKKVVKAPAKKAPAKKAPAKKAPVKKTAKKAAKKK